ncbi:hypothetical protein U1Q18_051636 [Sarracenia purpurea var. burkii]
MADYGFDVVEAKADMDAALTKASSEREAAIKAAMPRPCAPTAGVHLGAVVEHQRLLGLSDGVGQRLAHLLRDKPCAAPAAQLTQRVLVVEFLLEAVGHGPQGHQLVQCAVGVDGTDVALDALVRRAAGAGAGDHQGLDGQRGAGAHGGALQDLDGGPRRGQLRRRQLRGGQHHGRLHRRGGHDGVGRERATVSVPEKAALMPTMSPPIMFRLPLMLVATSISSGGALEVIRGVVSWLVASRSTAEKTELTNRLPLTVRVPEVPEITPSRLTSPLTCRSSQTSSGSPPSCEMHSEVPYSEVKISGELNVTGSGVTVSLLWMVSTVSVTGVPPGAPMTTLSSNVTGAPPGMPLTMVVTSSVATSSVPTLKTPLTTRPLGKLVTPPMVRPPLNVAMPSNTDVDPTYSVPATSMLLNDSAPSTEQRAVDGDVVLEGCGAAHRREAADAAAQIHVAAGLERRARRYQVARERRRAGRRREGAARVRKVARQNNGTRDAALRQDLALHHQVLADGDGAATQRRRPAGDVDAVVKQRRAVADAVGAVLTRQALDALDTLNALDALLALLTPGPGGQTWTQSSTGMTVLGGGAQA